MTIDRVRPRPMPSGERAARVQACSSPKARPGGGLHACCTVATRMLHGELYARYPFGSVARLCVVVRSSVGAPARPGRGSAPSSAAVLYTVARPTNAIDIAMLSDSQRSVATAVATNQTGCAWRSSPRRDGDRSEGGGGGLPGNPLDLSMGLLLAVWGPTHFQPSAINQMPMVSEQVEFARGHIAHASNRSCRYLSARDGNAHQRVSNTGGGSRGMLANSVGVFALTRSLRCHGATGRCWTPDKAPTATTVSQLVGGMFAHL
jgi:hypothetical protein